MIDVPLSDFKYIDHKNDKKVSDELCEMWEEHPKGFNYDTNTVTEAYNRAYPSKES